MKNFEQKLINFDVEIIFGQALDELKGLSGESKRLRSCKAWIYETENYYLLKSYNTIIACIEKSTDTLYDALRLVFGYTATSASHIAKFRYDYGADKCGCEHKKTWRPI